MNFAHYLEQYQQRINRILDHILPAPIYGTNRLHEAMRYAVLNGGKRIRPSLVYATGEIFNLPIEQLDGPACAVELIHCYSLVHDDLPAMDDDDLRRGKPTCHKAFDEATAILVGDALQSLAFEVLSNPNQNQPSANVRLKMLSTLANASGSIGMVGGQSLDLAAENQQLKIDELETLHSLKTGALICASVKLGALTAECTNKELLALEKFSQQIGLAFQIQDDILDIEESTETLGKHQGADIALQKSTFPALLGLEKSKQKAKALYQNALESLQIFDEKANVLRLLASHIVQRRY